MNLQLTSTEAQLLADVLRIYLDGFEFEIARTEHQNELRESLRQRADALDRILRQLRAGVEADESAFA